MREADGEWEIVASEPTIEVQQRIEIIQTLISAQGTERYGKLQQQAAKKLGISIRSLQRLVKRWREQGLSALSKQPRADQGAVRISSEWRDFILKTYREGNRGSRSMTPAQVVLRVRARAQELGVADYPKRTTVYSILQPQIEKQQAKRSLGWRGDRLLITTREGIELAIEWSNQVWQCDHTKIDVLVVDQSGEVLGRPWLTIVVDTYSRCIMGLHLGFDAPSAQVVGLALRHAILPKQYPTAYELQQVWDTYGLPQYLYTDGGKDFRSQHLEQVATELGIVLCLRRKPSDGGIVERPFGTFNREFFSTLPGYVSSNVETRSPQAETEACLTLLQLERLLVRYVVDHYNQRIDARMGDQSRVGRWEAGRMAQLPLLGERELDICLMRRDQRTVYRNGYIQFANLTYQGEHLAAYAGETVILRYDPRDITTVWIYQLQDSKEVFLTRAHAQGLETEILAYAEAKAMSRRIRAAGQEVSQRSLLNEVRDRDRVIDQVQRQHKQRKSAIATGSVIAQPQVEIEVEKPSSPSEPMMIEQPKLIASLTEQANPEPVKPQKPVPYVRVYENYEQLRREANPL
ncbi:Mu transposase C-terminal domain-containing protein [Pseudanabaenaceae cyanobacterium LEGE 13415]|nr:Mu transposase C-terminal domain-containing protein [Pseudanabaenaceae cyanobacterium LEGE 13415]